MGLSAIVNINVFIVQNRIFKINEVYDLICLEWGDQDILFIGII
jgi:hypothetical protein